MRFTGRAQGVRKPRARRQNPALAILNPLPRPLAAFARKLTAAERKQFLAALVKYREFHGTYPKSVERAGTVAGTKAQFLVGMGETEDVSYSANNTKTHRGSKKSGMPYRHEFASRPQMATDPNGKFIVIFNKRGARKRFKIDEWIFG